MAGSIDRIKGTVKWFDGRRGFGFISPEDGGETVFVHQSSIKAMDYRSLTVGETIEFSVSVGDDGRPRAADVTGPAGAYLKRKRYFGGACFRCGEVGHMAMDCNPRVGPCYSCGEMGHLARECPSARIEPSSPRENLLEPLNRPVSDEDEELPRGKEERSWAELPRDVLLVIFKKIAVGDVIMSAQFVCRQWRQLSLEPELWRCINMMNEGGRFKIKDLESMAMMAVDRSEGCVEEFCAVNFGINMLMGYLAGRATQLRCLRLITVYNITGIALAQAIRRFPRLEELEISCCFFTEEVVERIGLACPQLKSFKLTARPYNFEKDSESVESDLEENSDTEALAIAKHMQQLRCLQLFINTLTNIGLSAILDNCLHLECLDISECLNFNLDENLKEKCARIKDLRLPNDCGSEVDTTTAEPEAFDEDFESASFESGSFESASFGSEHASHEASAGSQSEEMERLRQQIQVQMIAQVAMQEQMTAMQEQMNRMQRRQGNEKFQVEDIHEEETDSD